MAEGGHPPPGPPGRGPRGGRRAEGARGAGPEGGGWCGARGGGRRPGGAAAAEAEQERESERAPGPGGSRRGAGGARGRERAGPTRSHPEPGRDPAQRRRVLRGRPRGRRGRRGRPRPPDPSGDPSCLPRRGVEQRQLVGLITQRSGVRIPPPLPISKGSPFHDTPWKGLSRARREAGPGACRPGSPGLPPPVSPPSVRTEILPVSERVGEGDVRAGRTKVPSGSPEVSRRDCPPTVGFGTGPQALGLRAVTKIASLGMRIVPSSPRNDS